MVNLTKLSPTALKAAMNGGTAGWGQIASANDHVRYMDPWPEGRRKGRCRCPCGCGKLITHVGKANGLALMDGCELRVARWVRNGFTAPGAR
jgi:hypothetical protein